MQQKNGRRMLNYNADRILNYGKIKATANFMGWLLSQDRAIQMQLHRIECLRQISDQIINMLNSHR